MIDDLPAFLARARAHDLASEVPLANTDRDAGLDLLERTAGDLPAFMEQAEPDQVGAVFYLLGRL